jgi:hypothetical protein
MTVDERRVGPCAGQTLSSCLGPFGMTVGAPSSVTDEERRGCLQAIEHASLWMRWNWCFSERVSSSLKPLSWPSVVATNHRCLTRNPVHCRAPCVYCIPWTGEAAPHPSPVCCVRMPVEPRRLPENVRVPDREPTIECRRALKHATTGIFHPFGTASRPRPLWKEAFRSAEFAWHLSKLSTEFLWSVHSLPASVFFKGLMSWRLQTPFLSSAD